MPNLLLGPTELRELRDNLSGKNIKKGGWYRNCIGNDPRYLLFRGKLKREEKFNINELFRNIRRETYRFSCQRI